MEPSKDTLNRWPWEAIGGREKTVEKVPGKENGQWPDAASQGAAAILQFQRGIPVPWGYGQEFGQPEFKVTGLRAGGSGVVLLIESSRFGAKRLYAAKTLQRFLLPDYLQLPGWQQEKIAQAFLEEALPWLEMGQHPHIVPVMLLQNVLHPEFKRQIPFTFSRFIPLGNLKDYLSQKGRLNVQEALALGIQLCDGLLHAYQHGITAHLDLKPDNIMVYDFGVFQVTDFSAGIWGTPLYMAPEQVAAWWQEKKKVKLTAEPLPLDHRADQWAVGLILMEALTGKYPFPWCAKNPVDYYQAKNFIEKGAGDLEDVALPPKLQSLLQEALDPQPQNRLPDISSLRSAVGEVYFQICGQYVPPQTEIDDSSRWWFDRGEAFSTLRLFYSMEKPLQNALNRSKNMPSQKFFQALCYHNLGNCYKQTGRFHEAEAAYLEAMAGYKGVPDTNAYHAHCQTDIGIIYGQTGRFSESEAALKGALAGFRDIPGTNLNQYLCYTNLGNVFMQTGRLPKAVEAYKKAMSGFKDIPGTEFYQACCQECLGIVYRLTDQLSEAEKAYLQALKIYQSIPGSEITKANCLCNLGNVYRLFGRLNEAEKTYLAALKVYKANPGAALERSKCLMNLSKLYSGEYNRLEEARQYAREAL